MSITHMAVVWRLPDPELRDSRLLTLLALADFANDVGECWPGQPTLAQRARVSQRHISRVIDWLEEQGYIEILVKGNGKGHSSHYRLLLKGDILSANGAPKGDNLPPNNRKKDDKLSPNRRRTPKDDKMSPNTRTKGDIGDTKGDTGDTQSMTPRSSDPLIEPSTYPSGKDQGNVAAYAATALLPTQNEYVLALCYLSYKHQSPQSLTEAHRLSLHAEAKRIRDAGYTLPELREWFKIHWSQHWRWKQGKDRPKPSEVRELIAQVRPQPTGDHAADEYADVLDRPLPPAAVGIPVGQTPPAPTDPWSLTLAELAHTQRPDVMEWLEGSVLTQGVPAAGGSVESDSTLHYHVQLARPDGASWIASRLSGPIRRILARHLGQSQIVVTVTVPEPEPAP